MDGARWGSWEVGKTKIDEVKGVVGSLKEVSIWASPLYAWEGVESPW